MTHGPKEPRNWRIAGPILDVMRVAVASLFLLAGARSRTIRHLGVSRRHALCVMDWSGFEPEASGLQNRRSSGLIYQPIPRRRERPPSYAFGAAPITDSQTWSSFGTVGRRRISDGSTHSARVCSQSSRTSVDRVRNRNG